MKILGIESSADETSAAVVADGRELLSNEVATSLDLHSFYGGIVPEIAARSHLEVITPVVEKALATAGCDWDDIDGIAVTAGPGLIGSLLIGILAARTLAIIKDKPLYAVNHVEAHVYANFITSTKLTGYKLNGVTPEFPCLALIVSGGHTQIVLFEDHGRYNLLGQTRDDAIGEAFDKAAKISGLPYPGGPSIAKAAEIGDPESIKLPISHLENPYDFSFSGLKTAVLRAAQGLIGQDYTFPSKELPARLNGVQKADIAASFQHTAVKTVVDAVVKACLEHSPASLVIAGGVAANLELRRQLDDKSPVRPIYTDIKLCTDNAAMIAACAYYRRTTDKPADPYSLSPLPNLNM
ncbi:MAG TPA: tRNA (adenosine(37)-N6)-threonylcarbamoyltransferase complex transferase subunit TsaD [Candidatus Saccharimonadales bacterium]|nr:tRNA (adenosine(37)-N6)-threonylcarbamoyltransferase complex transferase subunit TsaD [Candidatus Saccharimonadales bacterium]